MSINYFWVNLQINGQVFKIVFYLKGQTCWLEFNEENNVWERKKHYSKFKKHTCM